MEVRWSYSIFYQLLHCRPKRQTKAGYQTMIVFKGAQLLVIRCLRFPVLPLAFALGRNFRTIESHLTEQDPFAFRHSEVVGSFAKRTCLGRNLHAEEGMAQNKFPAMHWFGCWLQPRFESLSHSETVLHDAFDIIWQDNLSLSKFDLLLCAATGHSRGVLVQDICFFVHSFFFRLVRSSKGFSTSPCWHEGSGPFEPGDGADGSQIHLNPEVPRGWCPGKFGRPFSWCSRRPPCWGQDSWKDLVRMGQDEHRA